MENKEDELLDSALDDFEEDKEETPNEPEPTLHEKLQDINAEDEEGLPDMSDLDQMMKNLMENLGSGEGTQNYEETMHQLGTAFEEFTKQNPNFAEEIESMTNELGDGNIVKDSFFELKEKLSEHLRNKQHEIPNEDMKRYKAQLSIYNEICNDIDAGREDGIMEKIMKLGEYGELPAELKPPEPEECLIM